jgi:hypothetical protein
MTHDSVTHAVEYTGMVMAGAAYVALLVYTHGLSATIGETLVAALLGALCSGAAFTVGELRGGDG